MAPTPMAYKRVQSVTAVLVFQLRCLTAPLECCDGSWGCRHNAFQLPHCHLTMLTRETMKQLPYFWKSFCTTRRILSNNGQMPLSSW